jgi:hypothetical protein
MPLGIASRFALLKPEESVAKKLSAPLAISFL